MKRTALIALVVLFVAVGCEQERPRTLTEPFLVLNAAANLDQCSNGAFATPTSPCAWQNGDLNSNNSHYREGNSVPFRAVLTGLASPSTDTLDIQYDNTASGKHAYDYLTSFNRTETNADPCVGVAPCALGTGQAIPPDPTLAAPPPITQVTGNIGIFNGAITSVTYLSLPTSREGTANQTSVRIIFTPSNATAVIAWGAHIASSIDWGPGNAAGSISGSPYHVRILALNGTGGNQDRSIKASAILPEPTITTQVNNATAPMGQSVSDVATLTGVNGAVTGTVSFFVCGPTTTTPIPSCNLGGTAVAGNPVTIVNGQATSGLFSPSQLGTYCFRAEYSPDASAQYSPGSATNTTTECVSVVKAQGTIGTAPNPTTGTVGATLNDLATLSAVTQSPLAGGTITFKLYAPGTCPSGTPAYTDVVTVSGNNDYGTATAGNNPGGFVSNAVGTWSWTAEYSGDQNNSPIPQTACNLEQVTLGKATPTVATAIHDALHNVVTSVDAGATVHDQATVTGGAFGAPTGLVDFTFFTSSDCTTGGSAAGSVALSSGVADPSTSEGPLVAGSYSFKAHYEGDGNYSAADSPCEPLTVNKIAATITTEIHDATHNPVTSVVAGSTVHDQATVSASSGLPTLRARAVSSKQLRSVIATTSGIGVPTGVVDFTFYTSGDCTTGGSAAGSVTLVNGVAHPSSPEGPLVAGSYSFKAHYEGDANYNPADSPCEPLTVNQATLTLTTQASGPVIVGQTIHDVATLGGGFNATGTISFSVFAPGDVNCTTALTPAPTSATVSGAGNYTSGNFATAAVGSYRWKASYSGDANNAAVSTACNDANEASTVNQATLTLTTQASGPVIVGQTIHDVATLSGGFNATGTISFSVFAPGDGNCTTALTPAPTSATVSGAGNYTSGNVTTAAVGSYRWIAGYSGDANNAAVSTACNDANEASTVNQATPALTTTASQPQSVPGAINDVAHLSAGVNPTGSISFTLYSDATCSAVATTSSTPVSGNGDYTSASFTANAGTYHWIASYSGDANNAAAGPTACADPNEQVTILKAQSTIGTSQTPAVGIAGVTLFSDAATIAGASPTGTMTFNLFGPNDATCSGAATAAGSVSIAGNGTYNSSAVTIGQAGTWRWVATYSGDVNNQPVSSGCNDEQVTVSAPGTFGKTMGFWGNTNGNYQLSSFFGSGGSVPLGSNAGVSGSRGFTVVNVTQSNKIEPKQLNACGAGTLVIFGTPIASCTLSPGLNLQTLNTLSGQTLALAYNITPSLVPGFSGQTITALSTATNNCSALLTSTLAAAPLNLTGGSTVNQVLTAANVLIANSAAGGSTTQAQAGDMNALLGCLNRDAP